MKTKANRYKEAPLFSDEGKALAAWMGWGVVTLLLIFGMMLMFMSAVAEAGSTTFTLDSPDEVAVYVVCREQGAFGPPPVPTEEARKEDGDVIYAYEGLDCALIIKAPASLHGLEAAIHGLREAAGVGE